MAQPSLNRRLDLEEPQQVIDGAGGFSTQWVTLGTIWADIRGRSGRETSGEAVSLSSTSYRVIVRAAPHGAPSRPVAGQRLRDGNRVFNIEAVAEYDSESRYLVCFSDEEVVV